MGEKDTEIQEKKERERERERERETIKIEGGENKDVGHG